MTTLKKEIDAYEAIRNELELNYRGQWVVFHDAEMHGSFDSFESAAESAVGQFGRGPYLIRQVGAPPVTLPVSVLQGINSASTR